LAYTTILEEVAEMLETEWGLADPLDASHLHFDAGWFDRKQLRATNINAQIIVSGPVSSSITYFGSDVVGGVVADGLRLVNHQYYVINVWVPIPAGDERTIYDDYAEQIRFEIVRIINENRSDFTCAKIMFALPIDAGIMRHELNAEPRILRYEITFMADRMS